MDLKQVKSQMNKEVYYDIGQINMSGSSIKNYIFTGCILRKSRSTEKFYYQAELRDTRGRKSIIIVDLNKVLLESDIKNLK